MIGASALCLLSGLSVPAAAQVPGTSFGLGLPVPPLDARSAGLGGASFGLLGGTLSLRSPADLVEIEHGMFGITVAPEGVDLRGPGGREAPGDRSRFSVLRAVVPLGEWRAAVGFGAELDQDWSAVFLDTLETSFERFPFEERREHDGGLSVADISLARRIGRLSVGASYQRLTGTLRQSFERRFEPGLETAALIANVDETATWAYSSWRLRGGVGLRVAERVRVGAAFTWASDLEAERDSVGTVRRFSLPTSLEGGVSVLLSRRLLAAVSGGWTNWSTSTGAGGVRADDVVWAGGGLEFTGPRVGSLHVPLRGGFRWTQLPFFPRGRGQPDERAATLGAGIVALQGRATVDAAVELGRRGKTPGSGFEESFRRLSLSFTLRQ